jgi:ATP-dependent DNA helicase HFM1/MER3
MKPNERSVLRELNKSPFLKYPIKDNISTTAHKVFIMIQAQLGGVELPNGKDAQVIRRQYLTDISLILDHARRLVRCIADCKIVDCDAISSRHALDLSRSLSAGFWESSNLQLRQIQQIGPAATRKLASGNINSIEKLSNLDTATIERLMGRNPPFGRKMLDSLAGFPRLSLAAEITGKVLSKAGNNPRVKVKAHLGYKNTKTLTWDGTKPSLTFMAETSGGTLVHFWRGNVQKLTQEQELKFDADIDSPEDEIRCQLACDDIVGTVVSFKLKPDLPASDFPPPKPNKQIQLLVKSNIKAADSDEDDEFGGAEFADEEVIAAVKSVEAAPQSDYGSDDFADIDDLDNVFGHGGSKKSSGDETLESVKMENGKWACNHACRDGQPLKNGQTCKHRCCREGLDKPRKMKRKVSVHIE